MITLATTNYEFDYNEYLDEVGEEEASEIGFSEWCNECINDYWDTDWNEFKRSFANGCPCVLFGKVQTWNGIFAIIPKRFGNVVDAAEYAINHSDAEDVDIVLEKGVIKITCQHHDGVNEFEIKALAKEPSECGYEDGEFKEITNKMPEVYHLAE